MAKPNAKGVSDTIMFVSRQTNDVETAGRLALEFANTLVSDRPGRDLLSNEEQLRSWLDDRASTLGAATKRSRRLPDYRRLRASIRGIFSAVATKQQMQDADMAIVNAYAAAVAGWPELRIADDGMPSIVARFSSDDWNVRALARIAESAIRLVGGPDRDRMGACDGPGCRRFFVAAHPARRWCDSGVCGNRVRVARWARRRRTGSKATGIIPDRPTTT